MMIGFGKHRSKRFWLYHEHFASYNLQTSTMISESMQMHVNMGILRDHLTLSVSFLLFSLYFNRSNSSTILMAV